MKRIACLILYLTLACALQAQSGSNHTTPEPPKVIGRISLVAPKLIAEVAPSPNFTLTAGFWLRASFYEEDARGELVYRPTVSPSITLEPRYYFNLDQRADKGRRTDFYSGWYIGIPFAIQFPDLRYTLGTVIGFQRTLGRRWYWNISFGPGITYNDNRFYLDGAGDFGLGIILNKME
jgi:hypothetical protein